MCLSPLSFSSSLPFISHHIFLYTGRVVHCAAVCPSCPAGGQLAACHASVSREKWWNSWFCWLTCILQVQSRSRAPDDTLACRPLWTKKQTKTKPYEAGSVTGNGCCILIAMPSPRRKKKRSKTYYLSAAWQQNLKDTENSFPVQTKAHMQIMVSCLRPLGTKYFLEFFLAINLQGVNTGTPG